LLDAIVAVIKEGERIIEKIEAERLTKSSVDTLNEKERLLGIRSGENLSFEERRRRITVRKWERGGPTNTEEFEAAMTYLLGSLTKIIPDYNNFSVLYEIEETGNHVNFNVAEEYVRRNKLGHLAHSYSVKTAIDTIELADQVTCSIKRYHKVGEFRCGMKPIKEINEVVL
jgi:hypothetical protein